MEKYNVYVCLFVFLLMMTTWNVCDGYKNIRLQDYLCSDKFINAIQRPFRGDPSTVLTEDRDSAAIITQTWNATSLSVFGPNKVKFDCSFRVQTPERAPRGIYTVITLLKFRQRQKKTDDDDGCIDYIQFSGGNRAPTERICNSISIEGPAGRLIFDQRDRELNVHIHIDKEYVINEPLQLRMVMTAHAECKYTGDFLCDPNNKYSCISRYFVRDNITNCLYPCRDEVSCFHDAIMNEEYDTTNLALSAITSLIFTMLGVGLCVWLCYKYWNCLTVQQRAHEASAVQERTADYPSINLPTATHADILAGLEYEQSVQEQRTAQTPKDLPPSYDSLFPDR